MLEPKLSAVNKDSCDIYVVIPVLNLTYMTMVKKIVKPRMLG